MASSLVFSGSSVFLSRSLVPPELFDALHDALRLNGAEVFLCCDPSRTGSDDYHVISSVDHEKFEDLKASGCNLVGPQCVFACAKKRIALPKQGYKCCLAMDGVKILASGFEKDEKVQIEKLVTAMGGVLHSKASLNVSFIIAKNVLAAKYKWAFNVLKKPVVTIQWLHQCWNEHRLVPQEPYRILPFTGLTICVTRIPADERKEMERLITTNGGKYSRDLTKKCTHLISDAPEGDKYLVARRWGHVNIVTPKWVDQSIARKGCVDEEHFRVCGSSISSLNGTKLGLTKIHGQDKATRSSQSVPSSALVEPEISQSCTTCSTEDTFATKVSEGVPDLQMKDGASVLDGSVAEDSENEDNDLYLSDCRVFLVGFQANQMRKLVNMLRKGGATRQMSLSEKLTHIIVGSPTENEWREVRSYAAWGVIKVVRTMWLEDCDREKREISVSQKYMVCDLHTEEVVTDSGFKQNKKFHTLASTLTDQASGFEELLPKENQGKERACAATPINSQAVTVGNEVEAVGQWDSHASCLQDGKSSKIFEGCRFCFSGCFPEDRRAEIVEWVLEGGGVMADDQGSQDAHFMVVRHGVMSSLNNATQRNISQPMIVSTHWIRSCLEDGHMPDVGSHILYSPLPCHIPLPGFESYRFCVSQYDEKERLLLRNLCFVLGAKFTEKLSRKVTHLICKFTSGPKFDAACRWGIKAVTVDWIIQCVKQNRTVELDQFQPTPATDQDRDAGACIISQYPSQAARMISGDIPSQLQPHSQGQSRLSADSQDIEGKLAVSKYSTSTKRLRQKGRSALSSDGTVCEVKMDHMRNSSMKGRCKNQMDPSLAAIEDYLQLSSKNEDVKPPVSDQSCFSPDRSIPAQKHTDSAPANVSNGVWLNRQEKPDTSCNSLHHKQKKRSRDSPGDTQGGAESLPSDLQGENPSDSCGSLGSLSNRMTKLPAADNAPQREGNKSSFDRFSETQTESQIVGYEEDLLGIQMLIDKARTQGKNPELDD